MMDNEEKPWIIQWDMSVYLNLTLSAGHNISACTDLLSLAVSDSTHFSHVSMIIFPSVSPPYDLMLIISANANPWVIGTNSFLP